MTIEMRIECVSPTQTEQLLALFKVLQLNTAPWYVHDTEYDTIGLIVFADTPEKAVVVASMLAMIAELAH